ncbi:MAG: homocysteine S-methyltransferase family protein, partial [Gordonibacter pamelaeae]
MADVCAAAANARAAARYVAGGLGPIGMLLEPLGTLPFEEAYEIFAERVRAVVDAGCNIVLIETMTVLR